MKTITGNWIIPTGGPLANGTITLKLTQDAVVSGTAQVAQQIVAFTLDANGAIPANSVIYGNDELSPSGTAYQIVVAPPGGGKLWGPQVVGIAGQSPINLNSVVPVGGAGGSASSVTYPNAVLQNPSGPQTVSGSIAFAGTATAQTPASADNSQNIATTAFVKEQGYLTSAPVTSVFSRTGAVTAQSGDYSVSQVTGAAPLNSPAFTGTPTAPTPATNDNSTKVATTAYVQANVTATPTTVLKKGSGSGNYSSTSSSYVQIDSTNLLYSVSVPTGWKLVINVVGCVCLTAGNDQGYIALTDSGTLLAEIECNPFSSGSIYFTPFSLVYVLTGDGNSHSIDLRYKVVTGSSTIYIANSSSTLTPMMKFFLTPST